jgi:hypothetical protein
MIEVSLNKWSADGYPGVVPGDLVQSTKPGHWATWGIIIFEALRRGCMANWRHSMRYRGNGLLYSQEAVDRIDKPFGELVGQNIRIWHNPAYSAAQRQTLCDEEDLRQGRLYDALGIGGQMLRPIPLIGDKLAHVVQVPFLNYCSEGRAEIEQKVLPGFCEGMDQVSPEDIDDWCRQAGWACSTFSLVA